MFKDIIGVYRENSGKQEMTQSGENVGGGVKFAACGGLIKIALGFISVSNEFNLVFFTMYGWPSGLLPSSLAALLPIHVATEFPNKLHNDAI